MTKLLAIETSAEACSVALHCEGETREIFEHAPMRHAELLLPAVQALLADSGLHLSDLDAIAFGRGPGSFTSLRIGIGVVQGLAWGADLPVVPVSSLATIAQEAFDRNPEECPTICVAMDARMQEVYSCKFRAGESGMVEAAGNEQVCAPGALTVAPGEQFIGAGNGFDRFTELEPLARRAVRCFPDIWPRAAVSVRLALAWLNDHEALAAVLAQPVYIRDKVAEKPARG